MAPPSVLVCEDYDELSRRAADLVCDVVSARPEASIVAATGETPMGLYADLARRRGAGAIDASGVRLFQLDEYMGIALDDRRSLFGWIVRSFTAPLGIPEQNVVRLSTGLALAAACEDYDRRLREAGGYDLAILGIGRNGHLGFNEPPSDASAPTRTVELSQQSIESSAGYWGGEEHVPRRAMTAGMRELLRAGTILLLASGAHKREIVDRALHGPVTSNVPASFLQRAETVTVLVDRDAWGDDGRPTG
jgi:glucosamine-6-phosphate deaminase